MRTDRQARSAAALSRCLAAWVAVVLAIAPGTRPLPASLAPTRAAAPLEFAVLDESGAQAKPRLPRVQPAQPWDPGLLTRWSWVETKRGLSPDSSPAVRRVAIDQPLVAPPVVGAHVAEPGDVFHRSSVGTARSPTGPPA